MCMEGGGGLLLKIKRLTLRSHEAKTLEKSLFFDSELGLQMDGTSGVKSEDFAPLSLK